jgi:hypothetical protein
MRILRIGCLEVSIVFVAGPSRLWRVPGAKEMTSKNIKYNVIAAGVRKDMERTQWIISKTEGQHLSEGFGNVAVDISSVHNLYRATGCS